MAIKTYLKTDTSKLSENFKVSEFKCKCGKHCNEIKIDEKLVEYLQKIRDHFGVPVNVNSAYRCPIHNQNVGGVPNSRHVLGQAADITVKGIAPRQVARYAEELGIPGIGLYETDADGHFVHVDTREKRSLWYGQASEPRDTFSKDKRIYRVQVGAYTVKANAEKMQSKLKAAGYNGFITKVGEYHKVQIGAFEIKTNADRLAAELKKKGFSTYIAKASV